MRSKAKSCRDESSSDSDWVTLPRHVTAKHCLDLGPANSIQRLLAHPVRTFYFLPVLTVTQRDGAPSAPNLRAASRAPAPHPVRTALAPAARGTSPSCAKGDLVACRPDAAGPVAGGRRRAWEPVAAAHGSRPGRPGPRPWSPAARRCRRHPPARHPRRGRRLRVRTAAPPEEVPLRGTSAGLGRARGVAGPADLDADGAPSCW